MEKRMKTSIVVITALMVAGFLFLIFANPLEDRVENLEKYLAKQEALIDSLQKNNHAQINSLNISMNQQLDLIDSLANVMNKKNSTLQALIDSLAHINNEQNSTLQTMINSLENVMNEQDANVQIIVDSLAHVNNEQDATFQTMSDSLENVMNEQDSTLQALIGSLAMNIGENIMALGNLITQQQYYADSLNLDMVGYIDSLFALQQSMIAELLESGIIALFTDTEVFSGAMPSSWTDLDLSSVVGKKQSLVMLRYKYNFSDSTYSYVAVRTNDSNFDSGSNTSINSILLNSTDNPSSFMLLQTDSGGMIEQRETSTNNANVTASVVFYLNQ